MNRFVARTFLSAGSRDIPVPFLKAWADWRLESRPNPLTGKSALHRPGPSSWSLVLGCVAVACLVAGCAHPPRLSQSTRTTIYERANVYFDQTVLIKPAESARPEFRLAPLVVQEVVDINTVLQSPYSVYYWRTFGRTANRQLEQFNYLWFHRDGDDEARLPQGVRITFDQTGKPMVWEILRDPSGARILFVSQAFEAAAMTNYPALLPGRRFWVEQAVEDAPNVVVARIIDDSPTAMGPILYLEADSHDVATLLCRCMDAQAREAVGMGIYGIATLDDAAVRWVSADTTPNIRRWLPGMPGDDLTQWLRLSSR